MIVIQSGRLYIQKEYQMTDSHRKTQLDKFKKKKQKYD